LDTNQKKIVALEDFLSIFPGHATGIKALADLRAEERQRVASKTPVETGQNETRKAPSVKPATTPGSRTIQTSQSNFVPWLVVILGFCLLLSSSAAFIKSYSSLQAQYKSVVANNQLISYNFDQLNRDYEILKSENSSLANRYNSLSGQYDSLNNEHAALWGKYNALSTEHTSLKTTYDSLLVDYNYYSSIIFSIQRDSYCSTLYLHPGTKSAPRF